MATNIKTEVKGDILTITVNLSEDHGPSKSGKTLIVASSHGFTNIDHKGSNIGISINVTKKK